MNFVLPQDPGICDPFFGLKFAGEGKGRQMPAPKWIFKTQNRVNELRSISAICATGSREFWLPLLRRYFTRPLEVSS